MRPPGLPAPDRPETQQRRQEPVQVQRGHPAPRRDGGTGGPAGPRWRPSTPAPACRRSPTGTGWPVAPWSRPMLDSRDCRAVATVNGCRGAARSQPRRQRGREAGPVDGQQPPAGVHGHDRLSGREQVDASRRSSRRCSARRCPGCSCPPATVVGSPGLQSSASAPVLMCAPSLPAALIVSTAGPVSVAACATSMAVTAAKYRDRSIGCGQWLGLHLLQHRAGSGAKALVHEADVVRGHRLGEIGVQRGRLRRGRREHFRVGSAGRRPG